MRPLAALVLATASLLAEVEIEGVSGVEMQSFLLHPESKHKNSITLYEELEAAYSADEFTLYGKLSAQQDYYDLAGDGSNRRTFLRLDELYGSYELEEGSLRAGRSVLFWGALEARNIVDVFNPQELRNDPFATDKLGVWNASYTHYTERGEISLIAKLYEEDQPMAAAPYAYYFFPEFTTYDEELKSEASRYRPTLYLGWTGSTESEYPLDYALIFQHGYDSQRYFALDSTQFPPEFTQHAYLVNKVMSYNTLVVGATLVKLEALYADVIDEPLISDYAHGALGVEHTLQPFEGGAELGLIAEYYRYKRFESGTYSDLDLFETFQNDLFLGLRLTLNDVADSSFVGGVVADLAYTEQSWFAEFTTRLGESFRLNVDYRYIEPSKSEATAFALLQRHQRIGAAVGYYF